MYLHQRIIQFTYCVHIALQNAFAVLRWDTGKVKDRFGGIGRFKGG